MLSVWWYKMDKIQNESFILRNISYKTPDITIKNQQIEIKQINIQYNAWEALTEIIKSRYSDSDPIYTLNIEPTFDIDASTYLAINGYYKQAISLLRFWFENSMFSIYYQDHPVEFNRFSIGEKSSKRFHMSFSGDLLDYLFEFENFQKFNENYSKFNKSKYKSKKDSYYFKSYKEWIQTLYDELSAHIHGRGFHRSSLANVKFYRGEVRYYNKDNFQYWCNLYSNVIQILIISF